MHYIGYKDMLIKHFIFQRTEVLHLKDCPRKISEGLFVLEKNKTLLKEGTVEILKWLTNRLYNNVIYHAFMQYDYF